MIAHVLVQVAEAAFLLILVGALALTVVLTNGPINLQALHDRIAQSLQERVGDRYAIDLGPTFLVHEFLGRRPGVPPPQRARSRRAHGHQRAGRQD